MIRVDLGEELLEEGAHRSLIPVTRRQVCPLGRSHSSVAPEPQQILGMEMRALYTWGKLV